MRNKLLTLINSQSKVKVELESTVSDLESLENEYSLCKEEMRALEYDSTEKYSELSTKYKSEKQIWNNEKRSLVEDNELFNSKIAKLEQEITKKLKPKNDFLEIQLNFYELRWPRTALSGSFKGYL